MKRGERRGEHGRLSPARADATSQTSARPDGVPKNVKILTIDGRQPGEKGYPLQ